MAKTDFKTVNEYIASKPKDAQASLKLVRSAIRKAVPGAIEAISYQIPGYKLNDVPLLYFAGWKGWLQDREQYKQRKGAAFSLREFHEQALKESGVPLPTLDRLLQ